MARRSVLRASDADREHVAERLRNASVEGRLHAEELEHRLGTALSARTYGELDAVLADLPRGRMTGVGRRRASVRFRHVSTLALVIVIPAALAIAAAVVVLIAAMFAAWGIVFGLTWLLLGHRVQALRGPVAARRRLRRYGRTDRRAVGDFLPWR